MLWQATGAVGSGGERRKATKKSCPGWVIDREKSTHIF